MQERLRFFILNSSPDCGIFTLDLLPQPGSQANIGREKIPQVASQPQECASEAADGPIIQRLTQSSRKCGANALISATLKNGLRCIFMSCRWLIRFPGSLIEKGSCFHEVHLPIHLRNRF